MKVEDKFFHQRGTGSLPSESTGLYRRASREDFFLGRSLFPWRYRKGKMTINPARTKRFRDKGWIKNAANLAWEIIRDLPSESSIACPGLRLLSKPAC
jgi:hypothetical protein